MAEHGESSTSQNQLAGGDATPSQQPPAPPSTPSLTRNDGTQAPPQSPSQSRNDGPQPPPPPTPAPLPPPDAPVEEGGILEQQQAEIENGWCQRINDFFLSLMATNTMLFLMVAAGTTSTYYAVHFFKENPTWPSIVGAVSYVFVAAIGRYSRDDFTFRGKPHFTIRAFCFVVSAGITVCIGVFYGTHKNDIKKYLLIGSAIFCLAEICQPNCDYGILQLFVCLPLQITVLNYKKHFTWWYVASVAEPFLGLILQLYFVRYFDAQYKLQKLRRHRRVRV